MDRLVGTACDFDQCKRGDSASSIGFADRRENRGARDEDGLTTVRPSAAGRVHRTCVCVAFVRGDQRWAADEAGGSRFSDAATCANSRALPLLLRSDTMPDRSFFMRP